MDHAEDYITLLRNYFKLGELHNLAKNTLIISSENRARRVYYIASGYVRIYSINDRGEQYTHIIYGPGEIFPLSWIIESDLNDWRYETLTEAQIYSVPVKQLFNDMKNQNGLALGMLKQAIEQYRIYTARVDNLEYKYASERVAYRLILLANRFGEHSGTSITIEPPLTHQLLGSSLNLSRESVSREMEKLVRKGLVRYNAARQIVLTDITELARTVHIPMHQGLSSAARNKLHD